MVASGYPVAARIGRASPAERLAVAALAGLALVLGNLSVINLFAPLDRAWAWLALWTVLWTLAHGPTRRLLRADLAAIVRHRRAACTAVGGLILLVALLWPLFGPSGLIYFDGTSNHDGYFWVSGAKYLQAHRYLDMPPLDRDHPWANLVRAVCGWHPAWGRVGGETLLATVASLVHADPVTIYWPVCAALFVPWTAAVFLVCRTFYIENLTVVAAGALGALQPLFVFFVVNSNLPNLLGVVVGAAALVAFERGLRATESRAGWLLLTTLATHAMLFSYPEIGPFVALPAALLAARALLRAGPARRRATAPIVAAMLGLALNPVTTVRAYRGFLHSLGAAQHQAQWVDIFHRLMPGQYPPALATLSVPGIHYLGTAAGLFFSAVLLLAAVAAWRRARDWWGAAATLAGGAILAGYTLATGFSYGWQKSVQFSAVFIAALVPVAALSIATAPVATALWVRLGRQALALGVAAVFLVALYFHVSDNVKWSQRKGLTRDWLALRTFAADHLSGTGVTVEQATFDYGFFDGMWAAYFLPDCRLVYGAVGRERGGYLRNTVYVEGDPAAPASGYSLVSRRWADAFGGRYERIFNGDQCVLLRGTNRMAASPVSPRAATAVAAH